MAAQRISLSAAFVEAAKVGIPPEKFKMELMQAAKLRFLPATAGRWVKVKLDVSPGDTLEHALKGTSLSPMLHQLQQEEKSLRACCISHHWFYDQYHTLVFTGKQWLLYFEVDDVRYDKWDISQSYWDMPVHIDENRWCIIFEDLANYYRYETTQIDFELRAVKDVWENFGPAIKAPLGRRPKYSVEKELATKWVQRNHLIGSSASYQTFVHSLHPDGLMPKSTLHRVFMPIWRGATDGN